MKNFPRKKNDFLAFTRCYQTVAGMRGESVRGVANEEMSAVPGEGVAGRAADGVSEVRIGADGYVTSNPRSDQARTPAVVQGSENPELANLPVVRNLSSLPSHEASASSARENLHSSSFSNSNFTRLWRAGESHLAEFSNGVQHTEGQFIRSSVNPSVAYLLAKSNPAPYAQAKSAGIVYSSHSNTNAGLSSSAADASLLGNAKLLGLSLNDSRPLVLVNRSEAARLNGISDNPENLFRAFFQTIRTLPFSQEAIASKASGLAGASSQPQFFAGITESLSRFFALPPAEQENLFAGFKNYFQNGNLSLLGFVQNVNSSGVQGLLQGVGHLLDSLFGTRFVQTFPQFWPMLGLLLIQTNLLPQNALNAALLAELSALMARRREKTKERKAPKLKRADRVAGKEQALSTDNYPEEDDAVDLFEAWFDEEDNSEALSFMWH